MPNHVDNYLDVTGPKKDVEAFRDKVYSIATATEKSWNREVGDKYPVVDFNATVPMPESVRDTTSGSNLSAEENLQKYGAKDWYAWSCKYWGTKWGAYDTREVETIKDGLRFFFQTAWASPDQWIAATSSQFPSLKFTDSWSDEGGPCGQITIENGEVTDEKELDAHEWHMQFDVPYQEEFNFITKGNYKKVIAKYSNADYPDHYGLTKYLFDRLEDKDLPLFLKFEWGELKNDFDERLKSKPKTQN